MKLRSVLISTMVAMLLTACSFTLAADITPPPDYVAPTPVPTLGPLYPITPPNPRNGAAIFAENCLPCHGAQGLGDGPQSMQLPVTVPAIGLPEVARTASPAAWYKIVTQGNLDRFMPPFFRSLSDQERWDVIAYALTLHTTQAEIARGQSVTLANCRECPKQFADQTRMAALSAKDLVAILRLGEGAIPPFAKELSDDEAYAVAAYLRTLTFSAPSQETALSTAPAPSTGSSNTPEPGTTSLPPSESAMSSGIGKITGMLDLPNGTEVTSLTVTLHGFDHSADQTSGPQEVLTLSTTAEPDGSYAFENVEMPVNRIFLAEVNYAGITYRSGFEAAQANTTELALPRLRLYEASTDASLLTLNQVHIYMDFAAEDKVQVIEVFAFTNSSQNSIVISQDGTEIPFIQLPEGATDQGYEAGQESAAFVSAKAGLAVLPSDKPYSIIAFFNLPFNEKQLEIRQPLAIDTPSILLLVPDGVRVVGKQLASGGLQVFQNNNYQQFSASGLKAGETLSFSVSGSPKISSSTSLPDRWGLLIGGGIIGLALILAGVTLYLRERRREPTDSVETEFESADEVLDAILALDDLHRAGRISDKAYEHRRGELKETLREFA